MTPAPARHVLRLFVAGHTAASARVAARARAVLEEHLPGNYELTVVDLYQQPDLAEHEGIVALPTLIRRQPPPRRVLIGDLSNRERLMLALDLDTPDAPA